MLRCWSVPPGPVPLVYQMFRYQQVWRFEYWRISWGTIFWLAFSLWFQILDIWLNLSDHGTLLQLTLNVYEKNSGDIMITSVCPFLYLSINGIFSYIVGLNQICCMPFPFARLLHHHVDFWPWARDQRVKCFDFCPVLYFLLNNCVQGLKIICCLPNLVC